MINTIPPKKNFWQKIEEGYPCEFTRFQEWLFYVLEHSGADLSLFKLTEMNTPMFLVWGPALSFFEELSILICMDYLPKDKTFIGTITQKRLTKSFYGLRREDAQRLTIVGAFNIFSERK